MLSFDSGTTDSMSFSPWSMPPSTKQHPQQSLLQELYDTTSTDYYPQYYHNVPIKLEESTIMVPSQPVLPSYSPYQHHPHHPQHHLAQHHQHHQQHQHHPNAQHPGAHMSVQHTDDAASKETQYLRRRCFNCHTTEPPSWRRSTLNPGKIVCNKCGLYERTHLRPRPLRFDELRSGGKPRKTASSTPSGAAGAGQLPKKAKLTNGLAARPLVRRSSVSSNSSVHSSSDWDDSLSVYSTGSGSVPPPSSSSPPTTPASNGGSPQLALSLPIEIHLQPLSNSTSSSPNLSSEIRLPGNPLVDLSYIPRKSHTSPAMYDPTPPTSSSASPSLPASAPSACRPSPPIWSAEPEDMGVGLAYGYGRHGHALGPYANANGTALRRSESGSPH